MRARFSFGYIVGFNFYCLIASFLWLSYFTEGIYNRTEARRSAAASLLLVLLPLLFQVAAAPIALHPVAATMNRLLLGSAGFRRHRARLERGLRLCARLDGGG